MKTFYRTSFNPDMIKHIISISLILSLCILGCAPNRTELGNGAYTGRLPKGWENAALHENEVIRIIRIWIPLPWELRIYPIQKNSDLKLGSSWTYIKIKQIDGPKVRVGQKWKQTLRRVWIYQKQFSDDNVLEASVDWRFDQKKAEQFLESIQRVNS